MNDDIVKGVGETVAAQAEEFNWVLLIIAVVGGIVVGAVVAWALAEWNKKLAEMENTRSMIAGVFCFFTMWGISMLDGQPHPWIHGAVAGILGMAGAQLWPALKAKIFKEAQLEEPAPPARMPSEEIERIADRLRDSE